MHRFQYMVRNDQHIPLTPSIPLSPGSDTVEARYVPKHTRIYCACTWAYIHSSQYVHRNDRYVPLIQFKLYDPDPTQLSLDISPSMQEYSVLGCELVCSGQNMSPEMTVMSPWSHRYFYSPDPIQLRQDISHNTIKARYWPKHTRIWCPCMLAYVHTSQYVLRNYRFVPLIP